MSGKYSDAPLMGNENTVDIFANIYLSFCGRGTMEYNFSRPDGASAAAEAEAAVPPDRFPALLGTLESPARLFLRSAAMIDGYICDYLVRLQLFK